MRDIIYNYLDEYIKLMKRRWNEPENYDILTKRKNFYKKTLNYLMNIQYHLNKKICKKYDFIKKIDFRSNYQYVTIAINRRNDCIHLLWTSIFHKIYNILDDILEGVYDDCSDNFNPSELFCVYLYKEYNFFKYEGLFE